MDDITSSHTAPGPVTFASDGVETYAKVIHDRLNHLQVLASSMYALPVLVCAGVARYTQAAGSAEAADVTVGVAAWFAMMLGSYFVLYQTAASIKAVRVWCALEALLPTDLRPKYFSHGKRREHQYEIAHTLPTWAFLASPLFLCGLGLWEWWGGVLALAAGGLVTFVQWRWLRRICEEDERPGSGGLPPTCAEPAPTTLRDKPAS